MTLIAIVLAAVLAGDPDVVKVTADFENATMTEVLENLTLLSQVPIELDDAAKKKIGDPKKERISFKAQDVTLTAAAKLIFTPRGREVKGRGQEEAGDHRDPVTCADVVSPEALICYRWRRANGDFRDRGKGTGTDARLGRPP